MRLSQLQVLSASVLICFLAFLSPCRGLPAEEQGTGWQPLFDGKTGVGWREVGGLVFPSDVWMVQDGCLKLIPKSESGADLISQRVFDDFELEFDWRLSPGGNSGVKYLVVEGQPDPDQMRKRNWALGLSSACLVLTVVLVFFAKVRRTTQALPVSLIICCLAAGGLSLWGGYYAVILSRPVSNAIGLEFQLFDNRQPASLSKNFSSGALYDLLAPTQDPTRPAGEFNGGRIVVKGNRLEHWINGIKVLECELGSPSLRERVMNSKFSRIPRFGEKTRGHISLQNHRDEVWFRNIRIRPL